MFLNFLKNFFLKRKLKNNVFNVNSNFSNEKIYTVGIIVDESYFDEKENLIKELIKNDISQNNIKLLVYKDKFKKNEVLKFPSFSMKDVSWNGEIQQQEATDFLSKPFDMLISYYDVTKAPLLLATQQSKAIFKVGFSTIDKRLNHFMINTNAENFKVFSDELFKYLRILNKI
ncbi:DUF6913 domain-containing protein [Flavobacterium arsenatis]|uniref:DUF6913 domain-containing protein n=1 Tax=Flavobacterium arsenatis TaxID=1484332 RepID=UPI0035B55874